MGVGFQGSTHSESEGGRPLAHDNNIDALRDKHAELEAKLEDEISRPLPDQTVISAIKRQKLRIKDQMVGLVHA